MDVHQTMRRLRADKEWLDEVIACLERFQRSNGFRAMALLDSHLARKGRFDRHEIGVRSRRQISRWLRDLRSL